MANQRRQNRNVSNHPVYSVASPVYDVHLYRSHPRLQLRGNAQFWPNKDGKRRITLQPTLNVFVSESEDHTLELAIRTHIQQIEEVSALNTTLEERRAELERAQEENDEFLINNEANYQLIFQELQRTQTVLKKIQPDGPRKAKERRRKLRQMKRISQNKTALDEVRLKQTKNLPHPINIEDKEESKDCISIEEIEKQIRETQEARNSLQNKFRADKGLIRIILIDYFIDKLYRIPSKETVSAIVRALMYGRCSIRQLEDGFGSELDIATDDQGMPIDADRQPIAVDMLVIRDAEESGEAIIDGETFAFLPKKQEGADKEPNAIIGSTKDGFFNLVIIPSRVMEVILSFEEQWVNHFTSTMMSVFALPAPETEAHAQEQKERVDESDGIHAVANNPPQHADEPPMTEKSDENFPRSELDTGQTRFDKAD